MTITRYSRRSPFLSPWREVEAVSDQLNRLFSSSNQSQPKQGAAWTPAVNVEETTEELLLSAELPGLSIEDVEIEVENNVLTLRGEKKSQQEEGDERRYHLFERSHGSFERRFTLPRTVKTQKISAEFKSGILHIQMPKAPEAKAKKITIKAEA